MDIFTYGKEIIVFGSIALTFLIVLIRTAGLRESVEDLKAETGKFPNHKPGNYALHDLEYSMQEAQNNLVQLRKAILLLTEGGRPFSDRIYREVLNSVDLSRVQGHSSEKSEHRDEDLDKCLAEMRSYVDEVYGKSVKKTKKKVGRPRKKKMKRVKK